jgi:hypothetical protein
LMSSCRIGTASSPTLVTGFCRLRSIPNATTTRTTVYWSSPSGIGCGSVFSTSRHSLWFLVLAASSDRGMPARSRFRSASTTCVSATAA